jgi:hypothetical protein
MRLPDLPTTQTWPSLIIEHKQTVGVSHPSSADRHFGALLVGTISVGVGGLYNDKASHIAVYLRAGDLVRRET